MSKHIDALLQGDGASEKFRSTMVELGLMEPERSLGQQDAAIAAHAARVVARLRSRGEQ